MTPESLFKTLPTIALLAVLLYACGPSIRRTYQSDNAFSRCFDMDYRPASSPDDKAVCWSNWLRDHVYNQPHDKIGYARLRLKELAEGISIPGPPGPEGAFDQRPETDEDSENENTQTVLSTTEETSSNEICETNCQSVFETCATACQTDAGVEETCSIACLKSLSQCIKLCHDTIETTDIE